MGNCVSDDNVVVTRSASTQTKCDTKQNKVGKERETAADRQRRQVIEAAAAPPPNGVPLEPKLIHKSEKLSVSVKQFRDTPTSPLHVTPTLASAMPSTPSHRRRSTDQDTSPSFSHSQRLSIVDDIRKDHVNIALERVMKHEEMVRTNSSSLMMPVLKMPKGGAGASSSMSMCATPTVAQAVAEVQKTASSRSPTVGALQLYVPRFSSIPPDGEGSGMLSFSSLKLCQSGHPVPSGGAALASTSIPGQSRSSFSLGVQVIPGSKSGSGDIQLVRPLSEPLRSNVSSWLLAQPQEQPPHPLPDHCSSIDNVAGTPLDAVMTPLDVPPRHEPEAQHLRNEHPKQQGAPPDQQTPHPSSSEGGELDAIILDLNDVGSGLEFLAEGNASPTDDVLSTPGSSRYGHVAAASMPTHEHRVNEVDNAPAATNRLEGDVTAAAAGDVVCEVPPISVEGDSGDKESQPPQRVWLLPTFISTNA